MRIAAIAALLPAIRLCSQIQPLSYDTPAYVDFEFGEITAPENSRAAVLNVYRSGEFRATTTIEFRTVEIEATEGIDFKGSGGTIVFQPGEGYKSIAIPLIDDDEPEPEESFRVELTAASPNTVLLRHGATVRIQDPPRRLSPPRIEIAPGPNRTIRLTWEGPENCALERAPEAAAGAWETVPELPMRTSNRCEVVLPADGKIWFYRVRVP